MDQEQIEQASVRLRQPERRQMVMVVRCPDDLVSATHPVRLMMAVVERLDLKRFYEPIQARRSIRRSRRGGGRRANGRRPSGWSGWSRP